MNNADVLPLKAKGPVMPAPILEGPAQIASTAIGSWTGVVSATHWDLYDRVKINGADFYVDDKELGHIHLDGEVHLATSRPLREALVSAGLAEPFRWYESWSQFRIRDAAGAEHATWLFKLNYDRLRGVPAERLMERIAARGQDVTG